MWFLYSDCWFDAHNPLTVPGSITDHAREIIKSGALMLTLGGDHYITYPILKAYAEKFHAGPGWLFLTGKKEVQNEYMFFSGFVGGRGGRAGLHTGALGLLLAEMQSGAREHPEGVW